MQLPEPPLDLDLVLELEGDLELKHTTPEEEVNSLNLDPEGPPASTLYTEKSETDGKNATLKISS